MSFEQDVQDGCEQIVHRFENDDGDILGVLRLFTLDLIRNKIVNWFIKLLTIAVFIEIITYLHYLLTANDLPETISHWQSTIFFTLDFIIIFHMATSDLTPICEKPKYYGFWSLDSVGYETHEQIKKEARKENLLGISGLLHSLIVGIGYALPSELQRHYQLIPTLLEKHKILLLLYRLHLIPVIYLMVARYYQGIYLMKNVHFQLELMTAQVSKLGKFMQNDPISELIANEKYQNHVEDKFKFIILHHQKLLKHFYYINRHLTEYFVPLMLLGGLHGFGSAVFISNGMSRGKYFLPIASFCLFQITFFRYSGACQELKDQAENLYIAVENLPWYTFMRNKKIASNYKIALQCLQKPMGLHFKQLIVDKRLSLMILSNIYQIFSVFVQLRK